MFLTLLAASPLWTHSPLLVLSPQGPILSGPLEALPLGRGMRSLRVSRPDLTAYLNLMNFSQVSGLETTSHRSLSCLLSLSSCPEPMATCPPPAHHSLPPRVSKYTPQKRNSLQREGHPSPHESHRHLDSLYLVLSLVLHKLYPLTRMRKLRLRGKRWMWCVTHNDVTSPELDAGWLSPTLSGGELPPMEP